jgi:hypothetical protein
MRGDMAVDFDDIKLTKHLTHGKIKEEFEYFEQRLLGRPELRVEYSDLGDWHLNFDDIAGVYVAFEDDELVYVGETGNLRSRMRDLRDPRTHKVKEMIDLLELPHDSLAFKAVTVLFGRKEVEEYMIAKHKPRYCGKGKRR